MVLVKACLNGAHLPGWHPALPVIPAQRGAAARASVEAGAGALHIHPKDVRGQNDLSAAVVAEAVTACRRAAPDVPVGVTTGAWAAPTPAARVGLIETWTTLPNFASVNWHESGAEQVATLLLERGVFVEAGLWTVAAATAYAASPLPCTLSARHHRRQRRSRRRRRRRGTTGRRADRCMSWSAP